MIYPRTQSLRIVDEEEKKEKKGRKREMEKGRQKDRNTKRKGVSKEGRANFLLHVYWWEAVDVDTYCQLCRCT